MKVGDRIGDYVCISVRPIVERGRSVLVRDLRAKSTAAGAHACRIAPTSADAIAVMAAGALLHAASYYDRSADALERLRRTTLSGRTVLIESARFNARAARECLRRAADLGYPYP